MHAELFILFQVLDISNLFLNFGCVRGGINNYFGGYKAKSNGNKVICKYICSKCSFTLQGWGNLRSD